jgi:hypothetical protein
LVLNITKNQFLRHFFVLIFLIITQLLTAQTTVSGTVLDKNKSNYIEGVRVFTTSGKISITDSLGRYSIKAAKDDSVYFVFNAKPTQKFAVNSIYNPSQFDISIHAVAKNAIPLLKEVVVYSKSFKQDSIENRETYAEVFAFHKARVETSISPNGSVGFDANELFNLFRFKRNKEIRKFQEMLVKEEEEKYVNYRFNKTFVRRVTQLKSPQLDTFLIWYRPTYYFASTSNQLEFNQYILNCLYQFRRISPVGKAKKED